MFSVLLLTPKVYAVIEYMDQYTFSYYDILFTNYMHGVHSISISVRNRQKVESLLKLIFSFR